ncbi:type II toxin-antitoxin system death-on-curing family toxin [Arcanobacterium phocae]|uniref:type II toxin-antitoxin system death-on-curing family toxin n=1 Tax=Arcanobacterium phocae TaxID=131112 RepID=UPI001C0EB90C
MNRFGGINGLRDESLLESALPTPFQTFDHYPLYPDPIRRAAKLAYSLISNHPFIDGNKRTGVTIMGIYLKLEGFELTATNEELIELGLKIATHAELSYISNWLGSHTARIH